MTAISITLIGLHTFVAWVLIEIFVNTCHKLTRARYVLFHYLAVLGAFGVVFSFYYRFFGSGELFWTTMTAFGFMVLFEFLVFRYLPLLL